MDEIQQQAGTDILETRDTGRVEAFSDGVFAVAITLLVLEIKIPRSHDYRLIHDLLAQWPEYVAYFYSFITIGIYWMNHHHIFKYIRKVDQVLLFLNVVSLSSIVLMPFGTGLLAEYIGRESVLEQYAAFVFSAISFSSGLTFALIWHYVACNRFLLEPGVDEHVVQALSKDYTFGIFLCAGALLLVFVNVPLSLALSLAIVMYFARPARLRGGSKHSAGQKMSE